MTIIVEDGTGIDGAETYHDRDFFNDFVSEWGLGNGSTLTDAVYEAAARRGTLVFDHVYAIRFPGLPLNYSQSLWFPMSGLVDARSYSLPYFPVQVKRAAAALTWYEATNPMSLLPSVTPSKTKRSVKAGPVTVEFDVTASGSGYAAGARPILSIVDGILAPLGGASSGGPTYFGSAVRG